MNTSLATLEDLATLHNRESLGSSKTLALEDDTQRSEKDGAKEEAAVSTVFEGRGTLEDPFVVKWLEGERENPLQWRNWKKWSIVGVVAMSTLCMAAGSSLYAGGIAQIIGYFKVSEITATAGLSLYVSPPLWPPAPWAIALWLTSRPP